MTPKEQRIAIAEATGRKFGRDIGYTHSQANLIYKPDPRGIHAGNDSKKYSPDYGFDPLNDLNAAIPLLGDNYDISCRNGIITVTVYIPSHEFDSVDEAADLPKAICCAFLRKIGKWA